jgi:hypothetical protein
MAALSVLGSSTQATSAPITFNYTATVFSSDLPGLADGTAMSGSFTYNTVGVDSSPVGPSFGYYPGDASLAATVDAGTYSFDGSAFSSAVRAVSDDFSTGSQYSEGFQLSGQWPALTSGTPGYTLVSADLILANFATTAPLPPFDSDAIPATLDLSDWATIQATGAGTKVAFQVLDVNFQDYFVVGQLTSLTVAPTPVAEPSTLLLLGTSMAVAGVRRFNRRRERVANT